jgi:hypothetical protein
MTFKQWLLSRVSDEQILSAIGARMLCCAVGAQNRTLGFSGDFDMWFRLCHDSWVARVEKDLGVSRARIKFVIRAYARRNSHRSYSEVFTAEKVLHPDMR